MFFTHSRSSPALADLHDQVNALFDAFIGGSALQLSGWDQTSHPMVNIWENDDFAELELQAPGAAAKDIDVSVTGNQVQITIERNNQEKKDCHCHRKERTSGQSIRRFTLPWELDASQVQATLKDGILRLKLPRAAAGKPRKIKLLNA